MNYNFTVIPACFLLFFKFIGLLSHLWGNKYPPSAVCWPESRANLDKDGQMVWWTRQVQGAQEKTGGNRNWIYRYGFLDICLCPFAVSSLPFHMLVLSSLPLSSLECHWPESGWWWLSSVFFLTPLTFSASSASPCINWSSHPHVQWQFFCMGVGGGDAFISFKCVKSWLKLSTEKKNYHLHMSLITVALREKNFL